MREVEIKIQVESIEPIIAKLQELGAVVSEPIVQEDEIFATDTMIKQKVCVRIRKEETRSIYTYKKNLTSDLDCLELETEVSNSEDLKRILFETEHKLVVEVEKVRRKANYKGYEICLDKVANLGTFVEVEKLLEEDTDPQRTEAEIIEFINKTLGIEVTEQNRILKGYDTLLIQLQN